MPVLRSDLSGASVPAIADPGPIAPETETVYYQDPNVFVSSTRLTIGATTYAMANITSVSLQQDQSMMGCGVILVLFGALLGLSLLGAANPLGVLGVGLLIIGVVMLGRRPYVVRIGSASGESNALQNTNREYIQQIVNSVNPAIVERR